MADGSQNNANSFPVVEEWPSIEEDESLEVVQLSTTPSASSDDVGQKAYGKTASRPKQTIRDMAASCFLAAFIISCVGWVCLFSMMATHTDLAREKVYPAFQSKYFPDKEGARLFTYAGVLYCIAGTVSLAFLWRGVRLPRPPPWLVRHIRLFVPFVKRNIILNATVLEGMLIFLFLFVQVATIWFRVSKRFEVEYWATERVWFEVSKTLGKTAALTMTVLLLPIAKSCFWWDLLNFHFERVIKFHRWLAWFLVVVVFAHGLTAVVALIMTGQFKNCMWPSSDCEKPGGWDTWGGLETSRIYTYGWVSALIAIPLVITSLPWFRRNKFEWFYYTHFLFIPFLVLIHMHFLDMIYYVAPGLAAYALDKVLWFYCSRRPARIVSLTQPAPGFVRVVIAVEKGHTFQPGQWIQLRVPAVSKWEWHPMSVASAPGHSTMSIDIKVLGDWTKGLAKLAARFDVTNPAHTTAYLDRYHGSSHSVMQGYLNHNAVLMFAGGIGITPMMSSLRSLIEDSGNYSHIRRVVMVWCVKKKSVIGLYRSELAKFQTLGKTNSGCEVDVIVHATLSEKEDEGEQFVTVREDSTEDQDSPTGTNQRPFTQFFMGYGHSLMLTAIAGGGYILGIFTANVLGYEKEWRVEYLSLLQLCFAVLLATSLVAIGMGLSVFWVLPRMKQRTQTHVGVEVKESSVEDKLALAEESKELEVVLGCRPDVETIVDDMKSYCQKCSFSSVGVSVCGPELLVQTVMTNCRKASSSSVCFVVDDETFEW